MNTSTLNTSTLNTSTLTLHSHAAGTAAAEIAGPARIARTLVCKWDMLAVIGLLASSAVYSVYALTQMTGF